MPPQGIEKNVTFKEINFLTRTYDFPAMQDGRSYPNRPNC